MKPKIKILGNILMILFTLVGIAGAAFTTLMGNTDPFLYIMIFVFVLICIFIILVASINIANLNTKEDG